MSGGLKINESIPWRCKLRFSDDEIDAARELRRVGLPWTPAVGHYVFDELKQYDRPSPFQDGVYFVLNYQYFMRDMGGEERFQQCMLWLPTWEDARELLRELEVPEREVAEGLRKQRAMEAGIERLALYAILLDRLRGAAE